MPTKRSILVEHFKRARNSGVQTDGEDKWSCHGVSALSWTSKPGDNRTDLRHLVCQGNPPKMDTSWPDMWFSELVFTLTMGRSTDCCCSVAKSCRTLGDPIRTAARWAPVSFTVSWSLLRFMSTESWCYLSILSSTTPFSFCLQSFPALMDISKDGIQVSPSNMRCNETSIGAL